MKLLASKENSTAELYPKVDAVSGSPVDFLKRRIVFLSKRYEGRIAVNIIRLKSRGKSFSTDDSADYNKIIFFRMKEHLPPESSVLRMADDTFAIIYTGIEDVDTLGWLCNKKIGRLTDVIEIEGSKIYLEAYSGLSSLSSPPTTKENIIEFALLAVSQSFANCLEYYPDIKKYPVDQSLAVSTV